MDDTTLLHRQVNPSFVINNIISSQVFIKNSDIVASSVFTPTPKDKNKLSVYNGDKYSAEQSNDHFTKEFKSAGVVSVTVSECNSIELDVTEDNHPFDGHSYIDFSGLSSKKEIKRKAQKLKSFAIARNWSFKI